ncbi:hypothetical protein Zymop_0441 [Zymomonas mobilis subsp. pomaceae ATCC 29192]|uniref:Uncharacterized protein n=1 Tax=Zymomonas mobilis subsp. pomaceae (strain ATCC 29192 / DSM 22645 / JCM 10191 / CCUG 17912 / NBRC 13757 / NCIMB 11200 / NRRL B-4491 / Barker I) TaxID=579138 RepID=F8EVD7_ZYMMT|nr:hypothetical protein Zymop_0441 [Zymomonas mobilis subsp. pomaceae ATCC 29192]
MVSQIEIKNRQCSTLSDQYDYLVKGKINYYEGVS